MRSTSLLLFAGIVAWHGAASAQAVAAPIADGVQLGRYTTVEPIPAPSVGSPMTVIATVSFPRGYVQTVGDAVRYLLVRTGYQLVDEAQLDDAARKLLRLPLPESHRRLGPYRVDAMLQALLGDAWQLQIDAMTRSVRFVGAASISAGAINTSATAPRP
jgi:type IV pili sensor histidine kinase/response regulator